MSNEPYVSGCRVIPLYLTPSAAALRAVPSTLLASGAECRLDFSGPSSINGFWDAVSLDDDDGLSIIRPSDISPGNRGRWRITHAVTHTVAAGKTIVALSVPDAGAGTNGDGSTLVLSGGVKDGTGADGGVDLAVGGVTVLRAAYTPMGGGIPVVSLGPDNNICALVVNPSSSEFDFVFLPASATNGGTMAFTGQDTDLPNGNGGDLLFNSGQGNGTGGSGGVYFRVAGTTLLLAQDFAGAKVVELGDSSNLYISVKIHGPTVANVGGGSGGLVPTHAVKFKKVYDTDGSVYAIPLYAP